MVSLSSEAGRVVVMVTQAVVDVANQVELWSGMVQIDVDTLVHRELLAQHIFVQEGDGRAGQDSRDLFQQLGVRHDVVLANIFQHNYK